MATQAPAPVAAPTQGTVYGHAPAAPVSPAVGPARSASPYGYQPVEVQRFSTRPVPPAAQPPLVVTRTSAPPATSRPRSEPAEHAGVYGSAAGKRKAGLAVAALLFAFLVPPLGIVLGHVARRRSRKGIAATALFFAYVLTLAVAAAVVLRYRGVAPFDRSL